MTTMRMPIRGILKASAAAAIVLTGLSAGSALAGDAVPQNDLLNATLWMQRSVEYKATTLGIYNLAKGQLDKALADKTWTAIPDKQGENFGDKPPAIVLDADETILDNSPYEAWLAKTGQDYSGKT